MSRTARRYHRQLDQLALALAPEPVRMRKARGSLWRAQGSLPSVALSRVPKRKEIVVPRKGLGSRAKVTEVYTVDHAKGVQETCVRVRHLVLRKVQHLELTEFNRRFKPEKEPGT